MMKADGFDEAILGTAYRADGLGPMLAYDYFKCVQVLVDRDGMTWEEAIEWMDFNVTCAWVGEGTPIFIYPYDGDDDEAV